MTRVPGASALDTFALPIHGGDLVSAELRFGRPELGWLDLSTGINPYAYPVPELAPARWERLPESSLEGALRLAAAETYGLPNPEQIVCAPGTQILIQLLPRLRPFSNVAIVGPTYGEHTTCWTNAGHQVLPCETLDRIGDAQVVVVVNPNNPDGHRHDPQRLLEIADDLARKGGLLVLDEAFCDVCPELSLASQAGPGLLVLRSFGKFYGLAGLRLGFALCDKAQARLLRQVLGPWAVGGPALEIGRLALQDTAWAERTRHLLAQEAAQLDNLLVQSGFSVIGGTSLFRLVNASRAWALYEFLGQRGILVRPFTASPRWLRFGLPPGQTARDRLADALSEWR
ncbi:MAG TPA: threonine-phosphate decarboxylase CobD [Candidatus Sulfotelmatobacter sp.]|jgi:cobalamin biosynthetic protein CobC|nr:threonine-phosphate decarboxylase CobD [Candidatus Sulfotelmatobacter sp.]